MKRKLMLKKITSVSCAIIGATVLLTGCGKAKGESPEEKAALAAITDMRENLKSKQSLKLYSVDVKENDKYHIKIDYAADNSFGASVDDIQYYNIEKDSFEPEKIEKFSELFENGGRAERLEEDYDKCSGKETSVDVEWLMSNFE